MKRKPPIISSFFGPSSAKKKKTDENLKTKPSNKASVKGNVKEKETFTCLECMEKCYMENKLDDIQKYATIVRNNSSSIERHKKRHHTNQGNLKCSFVTTNST